MFANIISHVKEHHHPKAIHYHRDGGVDTRHTTHDVIIGERERANLVVQLAVIFVYRHIYIYIYIYRYIHNGRCTYRNSNQRQSSNARAL